MRKSALAVAAAALFHTASASAEDRSYAIAIGYNGTPAGAASSVEPLRFADDDAIAFFEFASPTVRSAYLLTVIDADTQRRFGASIPEGVRPPSLGELRAAVAEVQKALEQDRRDGNRTTVYLYYSGHGTSAEGQAPALTLIDGALTREILYEEILAELPATRVHLFVDACHAEAVVRPRDAQARATDLTRVDLTRYTLATTLARFPNVGAVMASTPKAEADEWELYQGGVFTHELLSGLRGAADVNGDGRIEYSELAAYLSAANREVHDPRAHLDAVVHPLLAEPRAAIVDLQTRRDSALLEGSADSLGTFYIEDERGDRVVDVHAEAGRAVRLLVPAPRTLFLRTPHGEAAVRTARGQHIALAALTLRPSSSRPRGAIETALHDGLFATAFGPSYYRGFVDQTSEFVPIPLSSDAAVATQSPNSLELDRSRNGQPILGWVLAGSGVATAATGGILALLAKSEDTRAAGEPGPSRNADSLSASRMGTVATVVGGVGLATGVAGAIVLLSAPHVRAGITLNATGLQLRGIF